MLAKIFKIGTSLAIICGFVSIISTKRSIRYAARATYDGSRFRGWQDQGNLKQRTVQGVLSKMLSRRFNYDVYVTGSSRTDVGVHAKGQGVHFDLNHEVEDLAQLQKSLNQMLPDDVRLYNISLAPKEKSETSRIGELWHATKSATGKYYSYTFTTNQYVDPTKRLYCGHIYRPIDLDVLADCLQQVEGTHDFLAFANRVEHKVKSYQGKRMSTVRTIHSARLHDLGQGYYRIDFHLNSALYKMLRNIVWTCAAVASSELTRSELEALLANGCPRTANKISPAPPEGLCLEHAYYDNY